MTARKLKVGVIGLGEVAQIIHLPILESLSHRYQISALCDISQQLLDTMGEKYRVTNLYNDSKQLTRQEDLDVVFVLNSDEYHTESVISAIENQKHVLVEKPMCLTQSDADAIINARDKYGVQVMVGYMRRFAPAFTAAIKEVQDLSRINYAKIRDIIGQNSLFIEQSSNVYRFNDIPQEVINEKEDRAKSMVAEAIGEGATKELASAYRLLCGLSSHDLSAMREIIGVPNRVASASQWNGGRFINAVFQYDNFYASFETGVDNIIRFDAHIEVFGQNKQIKVQYDNPYIRHLPTNLIIKETIDGNYQEKVIRPTFKDPYTHELEYLYDVVTKGMIPKTTPEDYKEDLNLFRKIIDVLKEPKVTSPIS
ncbi:Gfo/Idh/MocA family protein [Aquibacillus albus]|uniref:Dehydrogenase n=1 Tax=Aquibacillus albus TaxID=1168171 RepID=A0ABS2N0M6_9BACI|nr:Gfo/Idh/MocA family oxidoreductase [Aquibacillus albus]MBM7571664.1 putative dehydrogenase [Aquibacillus albus]